MKEFVAVAISAIVFGVVVSLAIERRETISSTENILQGATLQQLQMKQDCEKDLPRSQQCVIVVSAQIAKEK